MGNPVYSKRLDNKQLKRGRVYVANDGRLLLYLGQVSISGERWFYLVHRVNLIVKRTAIGRDATYEIYNFDNMDTYVKVCINNILSTEPIAEGLLHYRTGPVILGEYPGIILGKETVDNIIDHSSLREVKKYFREEVPITKNVKVSDLEVGRVYLSDTAYPERFIYLGRGKEGEFIWAFIGNIADFERDPYEFVATNWRIGEIKRTKYIKKLKGLDPRYSNIKLNLQ